MYVCGPLATLASALIFFVLSSFFNHIPWNESFAGGGEIHLSFSKIVIMWLLYAVPFLFIFLDSRKNLKDRSDTDVIPGLPWDSLNYSERLLALIKVIIIGPIAEEIFYRGLILDRFLKVVPWPLAVLVSNRIFGLAHLLYRKFHCPQIQEALTEAVRIRRILELQCQAVGAYVSNDLDRLSGVVETARQEDLVEQAFLVTGNDYPWDPSCIHVPPGHFEYSKERDEEVWTWFPITAVTLEQFKGLRDRLSSAHAREKELCKEELKLSTKQMVTESLKHDAASFLLAIGYICTGKNLLSSHHCTRMHQPVSIFEGWEILGCL
mmetsp:Transcript_46486/g.75875  ORF Transcript_46486/g.75875 Transcript_46486/m.75875 type:complete len:322 (-) Transcript_46486:424-1389(-)